MPVIRISEDLFKELQKRAEPFVDNPESVIWRILQTGKGGQRPSRNQEGLTPQKDFWRPILRTLVAGGGTAPAREVVKSVEVKMKDHLKPGDNKTNRDGMLKWEKAVHFQRLEMVHQGLLKRNSPRGLWEITDNGRQWLSQEERKLNEGPLCPKCRSSRVIPIIYGLPTLEMAKKGENGEVRLGGCIVTDGQPTSSCKDCGNEW